MTWAKYDTGFFAQCADAGLSDAATLTHAQAIHWLYQCDRENVMDMSIPTKAIRRFATTDDTEPAVAELVRVGFWVPADGGFELIHHGEVVRQSLMAQRVKKERDRKGAAARRARGSGKSVASDVASDVSDGVIGDTDIHTEHSFIDVGGQEKRPPRDDESWPKVAAVGASLDPARADRRVPTDRCLWCIELIGPGEGSMHPRCAREAAEFEHERTS